MVKRLPTRQETRVRSRGQEGPLEKEMAPHSSTLVWKIPWTEKPGRLQSKGSLRVGHDWATSLLSTIILLIVLEWGISLPVCGWQNNGLLKKCPVLILATFAYVKLLGERGEWTSWLEAQHSENEDHGIRSHHSMGNRWGNSGNSGWLYFSGLQNHCRWWLQPWN